MSFEPVFVSGIVVIILSRTEDYSSAVHCRVQTTRHLLWLSVLYFWTQNCYLGVGFPVTVSFKSDRFILYSEDELCVSPTVA